MFKGSFVALVTPFKGGKVDEKKIVELVQWHLNEGTHGLAPAGTTGESATLSMEEHIRVIELVVKTVKKKVPVVAGAGSNSTLEAVHLTQEAERVGVDAVFSVNPYYNKPPQECLFAHFSAVAQSTKLPIILYNIPSRTGVTLLPETMERLAKAHSNIVGVKEATGSLDIATEILERCGDKFTVMSGDDSLTLPLMSIGAKGVISVAANIIPKDIATMCSLALNGKFTEARAHHKKTLPLVKALFLETNPIPVKAAMEELGLVDDGNLRLPLVSISDPNREKLKRALIKYGIKIPLGAAS